MVRIVVTDSADTTKDRVGEKRIGRTEQLHEPSAEW
jgi:hypothetical protein